MKVYLDSVGCRLNQSEIEYMAGQFRRAGHSLVEDPAEAELVVVNTCTVTASAASDSRHTVRQAQRAGAGQIIVTGCWATLEAQQAAALPGVRGVIPNLRKDGLVAEVLSLPQGADLPPLARQPLPGSHLRTRAFIKVQDGCDNRCTFCVTRLARGAARSRTLPQVLTDVGAALAGGAQEIVLSGVQLGSWGRQLDPPLALHELVSAIFRHTDTPRLRLSSLEPWDLEEPFFDLLSEDRFCRHLHLPLQSGSAYILRRMARRMTPGRFAGLVERLRRACAEVAITTDVIVGFPGEGESEFAETLAFVERMEFAGGHVFTFSPRPGTAAAGFSDPVPLPARKERNAILRAALAESGLRYRQRFIGTTRFVLWESSIPSTGEGWVLEGLTDNYLRVSAHSRQRLWNQLSAVRLEQATEGGLLGQIVDVL